MSDLKDTISGLTKTITRTSGDFLKTAKLSMELTNEEAGLKSLYVEIGKKVHEVYSYGGSLGKFFDEKYREILECEKKIEDVKSKIDAAKGVRTCPKCGKTASRTSAYCPSCGGDMDGKAMEKEREKPVRSGAEHSIVSNEQAMPSLTPSPVSQTVESQPEKKICRVCGGKNEAGDKFCLVCGRAL